MIRNIFRVIEKGFFLQILEICFLFLKVPPLVVITTDSTLTLRGRMYEGPQSLSNISLWNTFASDKITRKHKTVCFGLVSLYNVMSPFVGYLIPIPTIEKQEFYYLKYSCRSRGPSPYCYANVFLSDLL